MLQFRGGILQLHQYADVLPAGREQPDTHLHRRTRERMQCEQSILWQTFERHRDRTADSIRNEAILLRTDVANLPFAHRGPDAGRFTLLRPRLPSRCFPTEPSISANRIRRNRIGRAIIRPRRALA